MRKPDFGFLTRSDTNQHIQPVLDWGGGGGGGGGGGEQNTTMFSFINIYPAGDMIL